MAANGVPAEGSNIGGGGRRLMRAGRNEKEMVILEESEIINHKFNFNVKLNANGVLSAE